MTGFDVGAGSWVTEGPHFRLALFLHRIVI